MSCSRETTINIKNQKQEAQALTCSSLAERSSSLRTRTWRITQKVPNPSKLNNNIKYISWIPKSNNSPTSYISFIFTELLAYETSGEINDIVCPNKNAETHVDGLPSSPRYSVVKSFAENPVRQDQKDQRLKWYCNLKKNIKHLELAHIFPFIWTQINTMQRINKVH